MGQQYRLLATIQVGIAAVSAVLMLPCFVVLVRTANLHVNCKCLLLLSLVSQMTIIVVQLVVVGCEVLLDIQEPQHLALDSRLLILHNSAYLQSSFCMLALVVDKMMAARNLAVYAKMRRPPLIPALLFLFVSLTVSSTASVYIHVGLLDVPLLFSKGSISWLFADKTEMRTEHVAYLMLIVDMAVIILSAVAARHSASRYEATTRGHSSLAERFQMHEVHEYNRALVPLCIVSSILKTIGLAPPLLWLYGYINYPINRAFFFTMHTLNSVVTKCLLLVLHRGLRRSARRFLPCLRVLNYRRYRIQEKKCARGAEGDKHFEMMQRTWETKTA